jgi:hexosaminidase
VYGFEPVPRELTAEEAHHVLGAQLNIFTEHMRTPERIQHNAFPRVAALAEMGWSAPERKDWRGFVSRLPAQLARYRKLGIAYADSVFEPRFTLRREGTSGKVRVELSNQAGSGEIRYSLNGSEPVRYQGPFEANMPATLTATAFANDQQVSSTRTRELDVQSLLRRTDDELRSCQQSLVLRLEDDAPFEGQRAVFNVDILDPCWIYEQADLSRVKGIAASVGQVPFNFQVGDEVKKIPFHRPDSAHGELEVRLGSCQGERIAVLPLEPAVRQDGVTALPQVALEPRAGKHDLCLRFTRWNIDPIWGIDWVQLVE